MEELYNLIITFIKDKSAEEYEAGDTITIVIDRNEALAIANVAKSGNEELKEEKFRKIYDADGNIHSLIFGDVLGYTLMAK